MSCYGYSCINDDSHCDSLRKQDKTYVANSEQIIEAENVFDIGIHKLVTGLVTCNETWSTE